MRSDNLANERIGQIGKNRFGSLMEIIEYKGNTDILVRFEHGNTVHTSWQAFLKGNVKNAYDKTVYGVGFFGEGKYKSSKIKKESPQYYTWESMLRRCYSIKSINKNITYKDVKVCEEWHNFQNFAKWYDENYYEVEGETICLDKDILYKGNKIYSPKTCIFAPHRINTLFIKNEAKRNDLPIGVHLRKDKTKPTYRVRCGNGYGKDIDLGSYISVQAAFKAYKVFKERLIKQIANEYQSKVPDKLYQALLGYEVTVSD